MAALVDAETGYSTVGDFTDTTPQPDSADSLASLFAPDSYSNFMWPQFAALAQGIQLSDSVSITSAESWGVVD